MRNKLFLNKILELNYPRIVYIVLKRGKKKKEKNNGHPRYHKLDV